MPRESEDLEHGRRDGGQRPADGTSMHSVAGDLIGHRDDRDGVHVPDGSAAQRPGPQAVPPYGGDAGAPGLPVGDSELIQIKLMKRITYILPLFCLIFSLASIVSMQGRINRLQGELSAAIQEARQLDAE